MPLIIPSRLQQLAGQMSGWLHQPLIATAAFVAVGGVTSLAVLAANQAPAGPPANEMPAVTGTAPVEPDRYRRVPDSGTAPGAGQPDKPSAGTPTAGKPAGSGITTGAKSSAAPSTVNQKSGYQPAVPGSGVPISPPSNPPTMPHISRVGNKLLRAGNEYKFAGINADTWFGCWANEDTATTEANLDRYFGELNRHSMTRIWPYANTDWQETMDRVVRLAEKHGQYLMVTLSDANGGGYQCGSNKGTAYPADGGVVKQHAQQIVARYKHSPAVAVWEICNECSRNAAHKPWYVSIAQAIKAIDSTTLVASGAGTCYDTTWQNCVAVEDFPENDLVSIHEYDYNGGGVSHWADETQNIAAQLGRPWFSGESGFTGGGRPTGLTTTNFGHHLTTEWNAYLNASGSAGMLYWDMKWTYDFEDTINVGGRGWDAARTFTHAWQGT